MNGILRAQEAIELGLHKTLKEQFKGAKEAAAQAKKTETSSTGSV